MAYATTSSSIVNRMIRAARLEVPLYEELEADITATNQALLVVVLVALAAGIGQAIGATLSGNSRALLGLLVSGVLSALISWAVWSYVVYFVGTRFFGGTATYGELLRTLGFAQAPRVLAILSFIPVLGGIIALVAAIWTLVASFIATRQALDIDNVKTFFTILIGAVALIIVIAIISLIFGAVFAAGALVGAAAR
jgi:hypothetical protein